MMKKYNAVQKEHLKKLDKGRTIGTIGGFLIAFCFIFTAILSCFNGRYKPSENSRITEYIERIPTPVYITLGIVDAVIFLIGVIVTTPCMIYIKKKMKGIKNGCK